MTTRGLEEFIKYLKDRTYDLKVRYGRGNTVSVSIFFIKDGTETQVITDEDRRVLSKIAELILMQKPEQVRVEITSNYKKEIHTYHMTNDLNNDNSPLPTNYFPTQNFGSVENIEQRSIESIVNKRLEEANKERQLADLKTEVNEKNESLTKKSAEIDKLKSEIETKAEEIEDLHNTIEKKKTIKYYAGITGDIFQSFGIKKEIIAAPLAGLLTGGKENESKAIAENTQTDDSGIIGDEQAELQSTTSKRAEMIALIGEYLKGVDNQTLTNIFTIFSEIENDPQISSIILQFLTDRK